MTELNFNIGEDIANDEQSGGNYIDTEGLYAGTLGTFKLRDGGGKEKAAVEMVFITSEEFEGIQSDEYGARKVCTTFLNFSPAMWQHKGGKNGLIKTFTMLASNFSTIEDFQAYLSSTASAAYKEKGMVGLAEALVEYANENFVEKDFFVLIEKKASYKAQSNGIYSRREYCNILSEGRFGGFMRMDEVEANKLYELKKNQLVSDDGEPAPKGGGVSTTAPAEDDGEDWG